MRRLLVPLACIALLSACSPSDEPSPSPTPSAVEPSAVQSPTPVSSPTPTPTPSPTPTAFPSYPADLPTGDPETAAIIKGWQEYWRVYEKFAADPLGSKDLTETQYVTTGRQSTIILDAIASFRESRLRSEGGRLVRDVSVGQITETAEGATAVVEYCVDAEQLRVFNIDTGEQVPRSGTYSESASMLQGPDGTWRVELIQNEKAKC